jgi:ceramide glucosyltransferase
MIFVFYALAAVLVWLSARSFVGGLAYLQYFKDELAKPPSGFTPFVSVIVPCRGLDDGLEENLTAVTEFDYPGYEVIFVVDGVDDAAMAVISPLAARVKSGSSCGRVPVVIKQIVAPRSVESGQKVENLREAVLHVDARSDVFVFADSDARPHKQWLRNLVARLEDKTVGVATGYRWFISKTPTFASEMRSVWNASIASALGRRSDFCWGGAMAIRRSIFEQLNIRERWRGTVSDDFLLARVMKEAGLPITFVPQALTPSAEDCTVHDLLEFTTRQMKLTRIYATPLWLMSLVGSGLFNVVMIAAFLIIILSNHNDLRVWLSLATIAAVAFFSIAKAWLRLRAVRLALPQYEAELKSQVWTQNTLWVLSPALFFYNSTAALLSRRMTWRGITYELKSPNETVIITD